MVDQHRPKRINRLYHNSVKELLHICIIHLLTRRVKEVYNERKIRHLSNGH